MASTKQALMSRGVNNVLAESLVKAGHKLKTLKTKSKLDLIALGFTEQQANELHKETRPPIPSGTLFKILHANKWSCCVCRQQSKPIVVYHIIPWAESRDHSEHNLAVICHDCHDDAHAKKNLSQNLTKKLLTKSKQEWEKTVLALDQRTIQKSSVLNGNCWYYFNHLRLLNLARDNGVEPKKISGHMMLHAQGYVDELGHPISQNDEKNTLYNYGDGMYVYHYMENLINEVLGSIDVINISDFLDKAQIKALARPNDLIFIQGAHVFADGVNGLRGPGQIRKGYRQVASVRVEYVFDAWEATSTSAWAVWLRGRQSAGSLCHVKSVENEDGVVLVKCTVLAIAFGLKDLKTRNYMNF